METMLILNGGAYCNPAHAYEYAYPKAKSVLAKRKRAETRERKEQLHSRSHWYARLQALINQWVVYVRDADKPCITCGESDPSKTYHSGHRILAGRGGADRRRFLLINLHKQCVYCNTYNGGKPAEYDAALDREHGEGTAQWLKEEKNHKTLKEQFPSIDDIKTEMLRYRVLLREKGIKPNE